MVSFPQDRLLGYDDLLNRIELPEGPFAIVAESFSGPLGIRIASANPERVVALVLVASFVRNPAWLAARFATWMSPIVGPHFLRKRLPGLALRMALLGSDAEQNEVNELRAVFATVEPAVLANRLCEIVSVNVERELISSKAPLLYLAGRRDRLVGARAHSQMKKLRPDMEFRLLDAPHMVLQRRPRESAELVAEFLRGKMD